MPEEDVRRLVDIEADLDDGQLSQVPFGRRRFLRTLGLALFGVATGMVASQEAARAAPTPTGCANDGTHRNYQRCPKCGWRGNEFVCTHNGCGPSTGACWSDTNCWISCVSRVQYKCCDFVYNNKPCICSYSMGPC
jgi:hypothetical protein